MINSSNSPAEKFLLALISNDHAQHDNLIHEDATLRIYGHTGMEAHRPRYRAIQRLTAESANWLDPTLEIFTLHQTENKTAVEFRIQVTIAPATLNDEGLGHLLDSNLFQHDARISIPPGLSGHQSLRRLWVETGRPNPSDNVILGVRWTAEEADNNIQAFINYHKERNIGFTWTVSSSDTPADLPRRLENHGCVLAGEQAIMAKPNLDKLDHITTNPTLEITQLDASQEEHIEAALHIFAASFQWTTNQLKNRRAGFIERYKNRAGNRDYLAYLDGRPVGFGRLNLSGPTAHLNGAATLPAYRSQGIYSTLLRHRLEVAHQFGHHIATIDAQPMSKPIVGRYGFKEYATSYIYAWMPVIDMAVINALVQSN